MDKTPPIVWEDRELRFDIKENLLSCRKGEKLIDSINSVEDTKGNNGERGSLVVTNLRILWISHNNSRINLSIGLNTIVTANIRKASSKLRGHTQALCLTSKFNNGKFEFIFTSLVLNSPRLFTTIQAIMRAYETSKLYRELKLRGSMIQDGELILFPLEQIFTKVGGVWNLSSDQGNLGTFFMTNVRIVWHANLATNFNVSLPYIQIKSLRVRESKFGKVLVIETYTRAGGYILGFRIDPLDKLDSVLSELQNLHHTYSVSPIFGVEYTIESAAPNIENLMQPRIEEDSEILDDGEDVQALASYYADGADRDESKFNDIFYDSQLGLAVEGLKEGLSLEKMWRII
jgi:Bardet-Biedl syndrome 5 protein